MNKLYIGAALATVCISGVSAQKKDSAYVREMLIEKEYTPVVRDAEKLVKMPGVDTPVPVKNVIRHSEPSTNISLSRNITNLRVGDVGTEYEYSKERGYLNFGIGNYWNINGDLGYKFLDTDNSVVGAYFNHNSASGKIKNLQDHKKQKMNHNDEYLKVFMSHKTEKNHFKGDVSYHYSGFNYYGFTPKIADISPDVYVFPIKTADQSINRFNLNLSMQSAYDAEWNYKSHVKLGTFALENPDINETTLGLGVNLSKKLSQKWRIAGDADVDMLFYSGVNSDLDNMGLFKFKAYFDYVDSESIALKVGLNLGFAYGETPYVGIAPDIHFSWRALERLTVYANVTGGLNQYSLAEETLENRYFRGLNQTKNSNTPFDLTFGLKTDILPNLNFDVFAKFAHTLNERFYYSYLHSDYYFMDVYMPIEGEWKGSFINYVDAYTAKCNQFSLGAKLNYRYSNIVDAKVKLQYNNYSVKKSKMDIDVASYKPGFETNVNLSVRAVDNVLIGVDYHLMSDRHALVYSGISYAYITNDVLPDDLGSMSNLSKEKLKSVNHLTLKGTYLFNEKYSMYLAFNNVLGQKYDIYYGMPSMGFNFMLGCSLKF